MKLIVAGNHMAVDFDLSDTVDVLPRYSDVAALFQDGSIGADAVAHAWLDHMWRDAA